MKERRKTKKELKLETAMGIYERQIRNHAQSYFRACEFMVQQKGALGHEEEMRGMAQLLMEQTSAAMEEVLKEARERLGDEAAQTLMEKARYYSSHPFEE